jgi:hypothetical protein
MKPVHTRHRMLWLTCGLLLAASAPWHGARSALADGPSKDESGRGLPKCIEVTPQALNRGYGYDHIVEIKNGCDKPAACVVKTSAITDPVERTVAPGQTERVLMQRGAPSGAFSPDVTCKL